MQEKTVYSLQYYMLLGTQLSLAILMFLVTRSSGLTLPIEYETPWQVWRSILGLGFFGFFLALMGRHCALVLFSIADQIDRSLAEKREQKSEEPFTPMVSIIVPAYNEGPCIEASIRSLLKLDYPRYEIIVVDDGSSDNTLSVARSLEGDYGKARVVVVWKPNSGKANALNFGIKHAASDFVTTIDGDSALSEDSLKMAIRHFRDPDVGGAAGHVTVVNPFNMWSRMQTLEYITSLNLVRRGQGFLRAVSIVPGPIGVFRKVALAGVGYYDHDTFAEDCDLTLKLLCDGWKIVYEPHAISRTEVPEELLALIKQRYRWTRGILQALRKYRWRMLKPNGCLTATVTLWYMLFEGLVWPFMTAFALLFIGTAGFDDAMRPTAAYFWLQLTLIDAAAIAHSLAMEQLPLKFVLYTPLMRTIFGVGLDVAKIFASFEEFFGVKMGWGKLARKGRV